MLAPLFFGQFLTSRASEASMFGINFKVSASRISPQRSFRNFAFLGKLSSLFSTHNFRQFSLIF